ncbi:MAG TPA: methyltransferase domain-containing protein [Albitalea sp.]|nr:methyltransferase domain-containing protein [Albitalea sp.]
MSGPTIAFWQQRFESGDLPWDRGTPSPQLAAWLAQGVLRPGQSVLVPGCGSGHEVVALASAGCAVTALDYAPAAVAQTQQRLHEAGQHADVRCVDVLQWAPDAPCDAVYEQTCLCAIHPDHWTAYAAQLHAWLRPGGTLCALLMQVCRDSAAHGVIEGPPYHCDINAMRALFPASRWDWPKPPYAALAHPRGWAELPVLLTRRAV